MKLAVVGGGAMGGALAAAADQAGHEVHVVDVSTELIRQINKHGLSVVRDGVELVAHPHATSDPADVGVVELAIVFVKAQHTLAATDTVRALSDETTTVMSLQNGWGNSDVIGRQLGTERLVFGVTYNSCNVGGLGRVNHSGRGPTYIGPYDSATPADVVDRCAELLDSAGWSTTVPDDVRTEIWKKVILNCVTLPTAALTSLPAGELGDCDPMRPLLESLTRETVAVAQSMGLPVDVDERWERIQATLAAAGPGRASMLQDTLAHRSTEIDVINGAAVRMGRQTGTPTPLNSAMVSLIKGLEAGWTVV